MASFQAINIEPEENIGEQVDNTRELHIEEALRRFQFALNLHAQGPAARDAADDAYKRLFESDIFKYREATTEYDRAERQAVQQPDASAPEPLAPDLDVNPDETSGGAASLSQALYLSYKNRGHFYIDKLKDKIKAGSDIKQQCRIFVDDADAKGALDNWVAALDQDPSDPEMWRRMARFSGAVGHSRLKRFCLEAAMELDDDPTVTQVQPPSLAEAFAGHELKSQLELLGDTMALSHPIMAPWLKKNVPAAIQKYMDPMPLLPDPSKALTPPWIKEDNDATALTLAEQDEEQPEEAIESWAVLGHRLMKCIHDTSGALRICQLILKTESVDQDVAMSDEIAKNDSLGAEQTSRHDDCAVADREDSGSQSQAQSVKERESASMARKRSQSIAGITEATEEDAGASEKRSKRVRRRTDTKEADEAKDASTAIAAQLHPYQEVDMMLFQRVRNILENLSVEDRQTLDCLQELCDSCAVEDRTSKITSFAAKDLRTAISDFSQDTALALLSKTGPPILKLSSFSEHAQAASQDKANVPQLNESRGLRSFAERIRQHGAQLTSKDICVEWLRAVSASYATHRWSEALKVAVVHMLNHADSALYETIMEGFDLAAHDAESLARAESMIMMILELHVDIYERITNPSSVVDILVRLQTKYRLDRWLNVASTLVHRLDRPQDDPVCLRFMWAAVMAFSLDDKPIRDHILLLWTSLRDHLISTKAEQINLPNNIVMPTISAAAADREISKLTTMEFFLNLFQEEIDNPVQVIEILEPVLNPSSVYACETAAATPEAASSSHSPPELGRPISECASQGMRDLWKFLLESSIELRLSLWSRLGDAYAAIQYATKRFSCLLKAIEMIVVDLESDTFAKTAAESRKLLLMRHLKSVDELLIPALSMALNDANAFDIIDRDHIKATCSALARLNCLLHMASLCEDEVRVGIASAPPSNSTYTAFTTKLREMQVRAWCLQYMLVKAGLAQHDSVLSHESDLINLLSAVHLAIGYRKFCKASNKIFPKMMRMELLKCNKVENWEDHLGQVLYDLHGLKLGIGLWELQDHACPHDKLEKRQAMQLVEKIMVLARRMPMKDLLKSDLKTTIEHMQQAIGQTKSTPQMIHNLRNYTEMLKRPIHPLRLYQSLTGGVVVDAVGVNIPEAALAKHGWFFLLGMIALTKFKGVDLNRRQTPGATDDLRLGATFLRLQLQFNPDDWQAWFRLAECFDYELDEAVLWSADKMNKDRTDLVRHQRSAIHCYQLALSYSRHIDVREHDGDPLHDLYHKFGMRLYSSSREPFAMEPFEHSDQERFFIENQGAKTFKRILHEQLSSYKVWKFAAKLFKMAMDRNQANWINPYMLAKCYWKMYQTDQSQLDATDLKAPVTKELVIKTLKKAIQVATNARKSRNSDPILEPHYKVVTILHKLVTRHDLAAADAASILSQQPFGVAIGPDDAFEPFTEPEHWEEYVIRNLSRLRDKDKSNWHHRIVMRHAKMLFDENTTPQDHDDFVEARAAFAILKENMFTKTMVMNVWKCDAERPGRHHVFTERYVRFMTKLLLIMTDHTNLELLLRRLRKKGADFYHFLDLWQFCCTAYLDLLRKIYRIRTPTDDAFKSISIEEFDIIGERISEWAAGENTQGSTLACLKEAVELKKLNGNLMKATLIDDLIYDCYTKIYVDVADSLPGLEPSKIIAERNHAKEVAAELEAITQRVDSLRGASYLSSILNPPNGQESLPGTNTPLEVDKSEAAPRSRRTVRRPDILRKAEQAVLRSVEAPKSAAAKSRVGSVSSKHGSLTPAVPASDAGGSEDEDEEGADAQMRREAGEEVDEEAKDMDGDGTDEGEEDEERSEIRVGDKEATEEGSMQDSADDESDLSDVPEGYDEEVPPGFLFPNLGREEQNAEKSGEEADEESEGNEETEVEDDGEGEGEEEEEEEEEEEGDEEEEGEGDEEEELDEQGGGGVQVQDDDVLMEDAE
ncbi:hypothetical protein CDD81_3467 [Ophiocordyceps australis]|uniref:Histone transcription regulator 3 homolog n=1 Tax=Ophiocordyceps australis TaxID=1399860 RepID=A0A2C5XAQ9_9HYPO|nr:hypothetical protein CDD81_3467 [Ophiocordyceps australis]